MQRDTHPKRSIQRLGLGVLLAAFCSVACAAEGASASSAPQASIPFVQHGGIRSWRADHNRGLWIQDTHRRWYYAKLLGPCFGLNFATSVGFDTRPFGTFDRFSDIVVPREGRCRVHSLTASDGPPRKKKTADKPREEKDG
jgi:Family of unknown function (DUF6491)